MNVSQTAHISAQQQQGYETSLAQNGRTFHWARRFLGATHGANAARLYAFCRLLDDLADGDLPDGKARLTSIAHDLNALSQDKNSPVTDPDMAEFVPFMLAMQIPPVALTHLIEGLLSDQERVALATEQALIIYGYQVAGTVGLMMCPVLSCHDKAAADFAIDLGIAMQFTNIARDVLEDAEMGRRYIPAQWVNDLSAARIAHGAKSGDKAVIQAMQQAIDQLLVLADRYYESGLAGLAYLPRRASLAIGIAAHSYRQIGVQLRNNRLNWHHGRTITSTATKAMTSRHALPYLWQRQYPKHHNSALHKALEGYAK